VITSRWNLFKNCQIFLNFYAVCFFLDMKTITTSIFLFSFFINSWSCFYSCHGWISTIGTKRHAVNSRKLILLSEGFYFLKHFFSCNTFGKLTTQERLFHVVLGRTVLHEYHELCIVSKICSLDQLWHKISISLRSSNFVSEYRLKVLGCANWWWCLKKNHS